jgi:hypothetical protein
LKSIRAIDRGSSLGFDTQSNGPTPWSARERIKLHASGCKVNLEGSKLLEHTGLYSDFEDTVYMVELLIVHTRKNTLEAG